MKKFFTLFAVYVLSLLMLLISCGNAFTETASDDVDSFRAESSGTSETSISKAVEEKADVIYDVNDYKKLGIEDNNEYIEFIRAFLSKDTEELERICFLKKGTYDALKTLEFGKYSISWLEKGASPLVFKFTVLSSGLDTLPPGEYSYYLDNLDGMTMSPVEETELTVLQENIRKWLVVNGDCLYKNYKLLNAEEQRLFNFRVTYFLLWQYGDLTLEQMQQYALELFGMKNFQPHESAGELVDGKYTILGRGGSIWKYDFTGERKEKDKTYVTVQFYTDSSGLIKSKTVEYEMQEKNGKWAFIGSKVIADSPYEPYHSSI